MEMKEKISITLNKEILENIDKRRRLVNRSVFIENLIIIGLKDEKKEQ